MTVFLYFIIAIGLIIILFMAFGVFTKTDTEKKDTAQRTIPLDEQQHEFKSSPFRKKGTQE
ncbi:MAG: hypothetical protein WD098_11375 [Balneolales bacterium]